MPFVNLASVEEFIAWSSSVHGVSAGSESEVYFDKTGSPSDDETPLSPGAPVGLDDG